MTTDLGNTGRRVKYLNNRDLLAEIHKSKCSYSSFIKKEYHQYDVIVSNISKIDEKVIEEADPDKVCA